MKRKFRMQPVLVTVPTGNTGAYETSFRFVDGYDRVTGVMTQVSNNGGRANFRIGINDQSGVVEDPHHNQNWVADTSTGHTERMKPMDFEADGRRAKIVIETDEATTAELKVELTFMLERTENQS